MKHTLKALAIAASMAAAQAEATNTGTISKHAGRKLRRVFPEWLGLGDC